MTDNKDIEKFIQGNPMQCSRCGWYGVTIRKNKYRYCVRWYCGQCGKWMRDEG